ncbi:MAG TPA: hypothetical protein VGG74_18680 [Kofleriaceae bacterium]|jgi:hypothetical protein
MTSRVDLRLRLRLVAALALVWCGAIGAWLATHAPPVAAAAAIDLTVTAGAVAYWLGVRGRTLAAIVAAGALAAKLVLGTVLVVAVALELATLAVIVVRVRTARRAWRAARDHRLDAALAAVLPPLAASLVATEVRVMGHAITGWRRRTSPAFAVHRASGWSLTAGVLVGLVAAETPAVHLLLVAVGAPTAAWIATALSIYSALWIVGDAHALRHGGIALADDVVVIELGVRWRARIPYAAIVRAVPGASAELDLAISQANVVVELREPAELIGLFGRRRTARSLALELDDPDAFVAALTSRCS